MRALLAIMTCLLSDAFSDYQKGVIREMSIKHSAPRFTTFVDIPLNGDFGFTTVPDRSHIYIDGGRLECCPRTFANVVHHEIEHAKGRDHNKVLGDIMSYAVTVSQAGAVIDDQYIWF